MDVQDQTTHTTPSGHGTHDGVHLCHRCGWPFPNPHPSAKHRRAHKKICGTIEGYTKLIGSEVVSDDEHHSDSEKEKSPSPKIETKGNFSRSEEEFADAVTEFVDSGTGTGNGSANKTLDRDMFFSFKDAENAEISKVNTSVEVSEKADTHVEKTEETDIKSASDSHVSNVELTGAGDLVKDGVVAPASEPKEAKAIDVMDAEKGQESQTSETISEEAKDSYITKTTPEVSAIVGGHNDDVKLENFEKLESVTTDGISEEIKQEAKPDCEHVSEIVKESEIVEEIKQEIKPDREHLSEAVKQSETVEEIKIAPEVVKGPETVEEIKIAPEVVKGPETVEEIKIAPEVVKGPKTVEEIKFAPEVLKGPETVEEIKIAPEVVKGPETVDLGGVGEEIKHDNIESDHKHIAEVAKESEIDQNVSIVNEKVDLGVPNEQIHEVVKEPVAIVTEKNDLEAPELEKSSREHIQEAVKEPTAVLIEKEDVGTPQLEKPSTEHTHEVVKEPVSVMTEKEDIGGPHLEKQSNEHTHEDVEKPESLLTANKDLGAPELKTCTQEIVEEPDSVLTEEDLGAPKLEQSSKDEVIEQKVSNGHNLVADVSTETVALKDSSDNSVIKSNNASGVVPEPIVEEGSDKLMNNQSSGADLTVDSSSQNSLAGTWGSVSVLSTTSIDAETIQSTEKSKVNSGKSNAATSDCFEPPSFMTLVEPKSKDNKSGTCEPQDSQPPPNSEASKAGWFPTLTEVNNESEGRKKNEEAMAKVANWSTGKQSTPLKNLLGEARSPSGKQPEPVVQKYEAAVNPPVNDDASSPPKLIDDGKKGRKKVKGGISSWVPFVCCSSVNAVK